MDKVKLATVFRHLLAAYDRQNWWPAETPFEVVVGAVLTQNTAWRNVERAIENLRQANLLQLESMLAADESILAQHIRPAGYFNVKARRLQHLCRHIADQGGIKQMMTQSTDSLREGLLKVHGVGPETADDILLYAFERPLFVIDTYTRRIFSRLGLVIGDEPYETLRKAFEQAIGQDVQVCNELHALIVRHAKEACSKRPKCGGCCLRGMCNGV